MLKILIVDDDPATVRLLRTLLELDGFEVYVAERGAQVLSAASQAAPDVILMDYHLSDVDGITVTKALREDNRFSRIPIIIASGENVEASARAAGATEFLLKPYEPGGLRSLCDRLVAK